MADDFASRLSAAMETHSAVRCFDVGGSGIKTGLLDVASLFEAFASQQPEQAAKCLNWLETPRLLGKAPLKAHVSAWLLEMIPSLEHGIDDVRVVFGVSSAGRRT